MKIKVGAATDTGLVRESNEDAYLSEPPLYAVADGMGGHRGGEVASALALETLGEGFKKEGAEGVAGTVQRANEAIYERGSRDREVAGMGTTLTVAVTGEDSLHLVHVGDSRAYLYRDGELKPLTEDHTMVQEMVNEGSLTREAARNHPQRSVLTRALGIGDDIELDDLEVGVRPGDRILLCTDGLTATVPDARVAELLSDNKDPQAAAEKLVEAANDAGGVDNTTVVVLDVEEGV
ncbi:MAG: Stp1/IreP family PP2C-type Ser/Thr phosphatase [Actinomycetota bacterium]